MSLGSEATGMSGPNEVFDVIVAAKVLSEIEVKIPTRILSIGILGDAFDSWDT